MPKLIQKLREPEDDPIARMKKTNPNFYMTKEEEERFLINYRKRKEEREQKKKENENK